jgi:hypothetical protein
MSSKRCVVVREVVWETGRATYYRFEDGWEPPTPVRVSVDMGKVRAKDIERMVAHATSDEQVTYLEDKWHEAWAE